MEKIKELAKELLTEVEAIEGVAELNKVKVKFAIGQKVWFIQSPNHYSENHTVEIDYLGSGVVRLIVYGKIADLQRTYQQYKGDDGQKHGVLYSIENLYFTTDKMGKWKSEDVLYGNKEVVLKKAKVMFKADKAKYIKDLEIKKKRQKEELKQKLKELG